MGDDDDQLIYLIAHKVRGQPALDIAVKVQIGNGEGWIIPTSGHRAYPWWHAWIGEFEFEGWDKHGLHEALNVMPSDWPDHYPTPSEAKQTGADLLKELGLTVRDWPVREFKRRI